MPVTMEDIGDLVTQTLDKFDRERNQTQRYTNWPLIAMFQEVRRNMTGTADNTHLRVREKGGFRWIGFYDVTPSNWVDVSLRIETPPRQGETDLAWDEMLSSINTGSEQLANILLDEYEAAEETHMNTMEESLATPPFNDSAANLQGVRGLGYWLRPLNAGQTDPVGGFNGQTIRFGDGTTSTTIAGQDASLAANTNLRNFAGTHGGTMTTTLVNQLRLADIETNFHTAPMVFGAEQPSGDRMIRVMPPSFYAAYEQIVQAGTQEVGQDAMGKGKSRIFMRGLPAVSSKVLESVSYLPVYTIRTSKFRFGVWGGWWMKRTTPRYRGATVYDVKIRSMCNAHCRNPREAGHVFHTAIAA